MRRPRTEPHNESASKSGVATGVKPLVFEIRKIGRRGHQVAADFVTTTEAANGQCSPHAVGRWRTQLERVLPTAQADTYLRALRSKVAQRPAAEPPLLLAEQRVYMSGVYISVWSLHRDSRVKVRLTETETDTDTC